MKARRTCSLFVLALCSWLAGPARAAAALDELLEQTRNARAIESQTHAAREQEFLANPIGRRSS
jgi:hypothetical protein